MQQQTPLLTDLIHTDTFDSSKNLWHTLASPSDPFDLNMNWSILSTVHDIDTTCIPGGLSQISLTTPPHTSPAQSDLRSPSPVTESAFPATISLNSLAHSSVPSSASSSSSSSSSRTAKAPHPYSISPANTTALFTRASSVVSNSSSSNNPPKKSRAPPSGPISTKDFIPPDVTGLTKREARLVKNRAAAFLSRQRKREEFEGLESRVEQLEAENARLQAQLSKASQSGLVPVPTSPPPAASVVANEHLTQLSRQQAQDLAQLKKSHANDLAQLAKSHANDAVQLKRAHASDVANVNTQLMEALQREERLQEELRTLRQSASNPIIKREDDADSEDSDADDEESSEKKENAKSAGSVAFMVLLFSLSTLLTNKSGTQAATSGSSAARGPTRSRPTSFSFPSYTPLVDYSGFDYNAMGLEYGAFGALDSASPFNIESLLSSSPEDDVTMSGFAGHSLSATSTTGTANPLSSSGLMASVAESAISSLKACGPDAFEFDFKGAGSKKIRVCVKGAGAGAALAAMKPSMAPATTSSSSFGFGSTIPSPIKFQPDDDLDMGWLAASSLTEAGQKRKRLMVEVNEPRPIVSRRKLSRESSSVSEVEEKWEINVSEEDYLDLSDSDHDVTMRL